MGWLAISVSVEDLVIKPISTRYSSMDSSTLSLGIKTVVYGGFCLLLL